MTTAQDPKKPTRGELQQIFRNQRVLRAFEQLFDLVPGDLTALDARVTVNEAKILTLQVDLDALEAAFNAFFDFTDITPAEAETLTDGSDAIGLHNHNSEIAARIALKI